MSKFKVRQRVRATQDVFRCPTAGETGTVIAIAAHGDADTGVQFDKYIRGHDCSAVPLKSGSTGKLGHCLWCSDTDLELSCTSATKKTARHIIVIKFDGPETTATEYIGSKIQRKSTTKCSPKDKYDEYDGTRYALARLYGEPSGTETPTKPTEEKFEHHRARVGETIVITHPIRSLGLYKKDDRFVVCNMPGSENLEGVYILVGADNTPYYIYAAEYDVVIPAPDRYDTMSLRELVTNACNRGWCESCVESARTKNCPLYDHAGLLEDCGEYSEAHPEMRRLLIDYLRAEDAAKTAGPGVKFTEAVK